MARRNIGGAEGFESKKKARKAQKIDDRRTKNTIDERENLLIACEDSVSAPLYFRAIFTDLVKNHAIAASSFVIAKHGHTDPEGVLEDLLAHPNYEEFSHKWIVIDRDEERTNGGGHTLENFNKAILEAKKNKVEVAYSNPCFEIWYLLHFEYRNTAIDRDEVLEKLESYIEYNKNVLPDLNADQQKFAVKNAERLIADWQATNYASKTSPESDNPSTTVHDLVNVLNGFKKKSVDS